MTRYSDTVSSSAHRHSPDFLRPLVVASIDDSFQNQLPSSWLLDDEFLILSLLLHLLIVLLCEQKLPLFFHVCLYFCEQHEFPLSSVVYNPLSLCNVVLESPLVWPVETPSTRHVCL